jgi:hypothetical protein
MSAYQNRLRPLWVDLRQSASRIPSTQYLAPGRSVITHGRVAHYGARGPVLPSSTQHLVRSSHVPHEALCAGHEAPASEYPLPRTKYDVGSAGALSSDIVLHSKNWIPGPGTEY